MEGHLINLDTSVRVFKELFDARITSARATKLDKLDATISSRASQSTADDIRLRVVDCQNKSNTINSTTAATKAKTDKLWRAPTSGGGGKIAHGKSITVSGSGVLRLLSCDGDSNAKIYLKIDGRVIYSYLTLVTQKGNLAGGGIRFNSQLYIVAQDYYSNSSTYPVFYAYTKGD